MTPQLTVLRNPVASHRTDAHLTDAEFDALLMDSAAAQSPAAAHLLCCTECAAELASLRGSIAMFREASSAYAEKELCSHPQAAVPGRRPFSPALEPGWCVAAAAVALAALLPAQWMRQHRPLPAPTAFTAAGVSSAPSDEALLDEVDREMSASVPASMQPLADPTADSTSSATTSTQRKD
jgi:hypothetical protein